jgi:hypothetical protein
MARDGTGTYVAPESPVVTATPISSSSYNASLADIGVALTGSLARDGQGGMTGILDMGTNRIANLGAPTLGGDAVNRSYIDALNLGGFRNLIINGNPIINQRSYVSGAAVGAANTYTLDRWRVVTSGQSVSWADSAGIRTVTAPAGGMEQVIEGASNLGGVHTISWTGSATATVGGSAVTNGGQVTLTGGANVTVRMIGGTWSQLQLEPGSQATPFERRPLAAEQALCERYAIRMSHYFEAYSPTGLFGTIKPSPWRSLMRATPTVTQIGLSSNNNTNAITFSAIDATAGYAVITNAGAGNCSIVADLLMTAEL